MITIGVIRISDVAVQVGGWTAAVLGVVGVLTLLWKVFKFFDGLAKLVNHELTHNGGSSLKDDSKKAADLSQETVDSLAGLKDVLDRHILESNALALSTERELGALTNRVTQLEEV